MFLNNAQLWVIPSDACFEDSLSILASAFEFALEREYQPDSFDCEAFKMWFDCVDPFSECFSVILTDPDSLPVGNIVFAREGYCRSAMSIARAPRSPEAGPSPA